jgi:hypothetical protein
MTMQITRKKFLDLSLGTLGAVGIGACGGDDGTDDGNNDTGSSGDDDDDDSMTDPSMTAADDDDDDGSSSMTDPSDSSSSAGTDPDSSSGPGDDSSSGPGDDSSSSGPGDDSSSSDGGEACSSDPTSSFDLHAHTLDIPLADVLAGVDADYIAGGGHDHDVHVTAENFAALAAGEEVVVTSGDGGMGPHSHMVTLICR